MSILPTSLYQCRQVKALDKAAIDMLPTTGFNLMMLAGQIALDLITEHWPTMDTLTVFCGAGNNGGDGYVVAALAHQSGLRTKVYYLAEPNNLNGEAKLAYEFANQHGVPIKAYHSATDPIEGLVVDALLGIGLNGEVRDAYVTAINSINASSRPILAIDIPSGICGDTGQVLGVAVQASCTVTYIGLKQGLLTGESREHIGELYFADLGVDGSVLATQQANCTRLQYSAPLLAKRRINAHKGMFGRVLVVAGDKGYGGAGIMAAESALQCGAGIVELATRNLHITAALARRPELIVQGIDAIDSLEASLESAGILVIGPGLGQSLWSQKVFDRCIERALPSVIDADGLNLLVNKEVVKNDNWILTPHPGEAARLLNTSTKRINSDRFTAAKTIQQKYGGVVVLKGAGTIIADKNSLYLCSAGNPAMSTPGMGDVLSGIIGGFLAHGLNLSNAAQLSVWAHATASDSTAKRLGKNLLATEIYADLRQLL